MTSIANIECVAEQVGIPAMTLADQAVVPLQPSSLQEWADRVNASWDAAVKNIIEVGRRLVAAKESLPHGAWCRLFPEDADPVARPIRFSRQKAFRLMAIAQHPVLSNVTYMQHLPPSWGTLYELTQLPEPILRALLERGDIHPSLRWPEAMALRLEAEAIALRLDAAQPPVRGEQPSQGNPGRRRRCASIASLIAKLTIAEATLRRYATEVSRELETPLQTDEHSKIVAGVFWLPSIPGPPTQAARQEKPCRHACPECGHVHVDRRTLTMVEGPQVATKGRRA